MAANTSNANLFISIHHNGGGGGDGYEVYNFTGSLKGSLIAELIAEEFDALGQNKRYVGSGLYAGTQKGDYYVLKHTNCPAALGEFGFMDTKDYTQFDELLELIDIGKAYGRAVLRYFEIEIKPEPDEEPLAKIVEVIADLEQTIKELKMLLK